jgi:hypothetical protein
MTRRMSITALHAGSKAELSKSVEAGAAAQPQRRAVLLVNRRSNTYPGTGTVTYAGWRPVQDLCAGKPWGYGLKRRSTLGQRTFTNRPADAITLLLCLLRDYQTKLTMFVRYIEGDCRSLAASGQVNYGISPDRRSRVDNLVVRTYKAALATRDAC